MSATLRGRSGPATGWVLLFALLAVYLLDSLRAAWLGAFAGYLFARLLALEAEVARLRETLEAAPRGDEAPAAAASTTAPAAAEAMTIAAAPEAARASSSSDDVAGAAMSSVPSYAAAAAVPSSTASPPIPEHAPWREPPPALSPALSELRARLGAWLGRGNPLARLGVLITFFGAAYLIKFAAEAGWLPVAWRLGGVAAAALAMIATGWRLRARATAYALTLQGGGLALLYLTALAAFRYYALLEPGMALALLVVVAAAGAALALAQDALPLAAIGFAGGFVAPLVIGGDGSHVALFGYYAVLNLGILAIALGRAWGALNLLGFVFTFVVTALWRTRAYRPELFASTEAFLLLFFTIYVALGLLQARRGGGDAGNRLSGLLNFGLPAVVLSLQATIVRELPWGLAWSAVGFGLFYLALAALLRPAHASRLVLLREAYVAIGVVLLSLAVPLRYDAQATASTWALEGAGAVWLGLRQQRWPARTFGLLVQVAAGAALLFDGSSGDAGTWLAPGATGALLLAGAGLASALWLHRGGAGLLPRERGLDAAAAFWALAWWLEAGLRQVAHLDRADAPGLRLAFVAATALALDAVALRAAWAWLRVLATFSILPFALWATAAALDDHPFARGGLYGWPLLFAAHYALLWRRERRPLAAAGEGTLSALHAGALWLAVLLAAQELAWQIDRTRPDDWVALAWGLVPALTLLALALGQPRWPVAAHETIYRRRGAPPLAAGLLAWIVVTCLGNAGDAAPLPTLPLLNPLDLTVAGAFAAIALWWLSLAPPERAALRPEPRGLLPAVVAGVAFVWLNSALVRGLHYAIGTPLGAWGIRHSAIVQAAFSIVWSLLGFVAMRVAARRMQREVWLAGAGLMVVVALKLFVVDTAGTGTLARIVAFLGVGALLLVAGYVAPLPPARGTASDRGADR